MENEKEVDSPTTVEQPSETTSASQATLTTDETIKEYNKKLLDVIENQNKIIDSLQKAATEHAKQIENMNEDLKKIDSDLKRNIPRVVGEFDFEKKFADLNKDELEEMYKKNRETYDLFKNIFKG